MAHGQVVSHLGPMVSIMYNNQLVKVNQSKVRKDHDEWHDVPLPTTLEEPLMRPEGNADTPAIADGGSASAATAYQSSTYFWQPVTHGTIDLLEVFSGLVM